MQCVVVRRGQEEQRRQPNATGEERGAAGAAASQQCLAKRDRRTSRSPAAAACRCSFFPTLHPQASARARNANMRPPPVPKDVAKGALSGRSWTMPRGLLSVPRSSLLSTIICCHLAWRLPCSPLFTDEAISALENQFDCNTCYRLLIIVPAVIEFLQRRKDYPRSLSLGHNRIPSLGGPSI